MSKGLGEQQVRTTLPTGSDQGMGMRPVGAVATAAEAASATENREFLTAEAAALKPLAKATGEAAA